MMPSVASLAFIHALQQQGAGVYIVGGTVRDELLGQARKDLDLLVTGLPQTALTRTLRSHGRVQLTGRAFGVIKFSPRGWEGPAIDIALPRVEVSTGIGHRDFDVTFDHTLPLEQDLGRRDFTINAMALDLANGHLVDPFGGHRDLQQRLLRQVSVQAFPEDPLRMLRGIQLAARLDLHIEPATYEAMCTHAASISTVAPERIAEELRKLFQARTPSQGFWAMHAVGLLAPLFPELARLAQHTAAFAHTMRRLDAVQQCTLLRHQGHLDLLLTALFCDCGLSDVPQPDQALAMEASHIAHQRLTRLAITTIGAHPDLIAALIAHHALSLEALETPAALRHFAYDVGLTEVFMLFDLHIADRISAEPPQPAHPVCALQQRLQAEMDCQTPLSLQALAINGHDLQHIGIAPGPHMGQILQHLLRHVLDAPQHNTRAHLLARARALHRQMMPTPNPPSNRQEASSTPS